MPLRNALSVLGLFRAGTRESSDDAPYVVLAGADDVCIGNREQGGPVRVLQPFLRLLMPYSIPRKAHPNFP